MKVLVIGSGGREHALVKAFSKSAIVERIYASPGNPGIKHLAETYALNLKDHASVVQFCIHYKINLVFIGPEEPLVNGLADSLREAQIHVVGPSKQAAHLEGSKIFAKQFMQKAGVATADAIIVTSVSKTLNAAKQYSAPYILKADGLAAGKGVFICQNLIELESAATDLFIHKKLGPAGEKALLEKNLPGYELSFLILTNGLDYQALPMAQDHKRLYDQNFGPNTGGMGTVAPLIISQELYEKITTKIIQPTLQQIKNDKMLYRGILFIGVMVVEDEPYALEYNVRFGDPETQVILPLIENDLGQLFHRLAHGELEQIQFKNLNTFCIVNAAPGYPDHPLADIELHLPSETEDCYILHAGTKQKKDGLLVSQGGRVLNVVSAHKDYETAKKMAYELNKKIDFKGRQFRTDIGSYQFQRKDN